jgi:hypothetical protein
MNKALCKMEYTRDAQGREVLLKDGKFQVMMEWERPYMEACIDALKPIGDVLEVGFGCGYSATRIQHYHPKSHTIIEYHPVVAAKAREWARSYPHVTIVEKTWQEALPLLGQFDTIFFDDYPLESEEEIKKMEKERDRSAGVLKEGHKRLEEVEKRLAFLKERRYSDQDIDSFFSLLDERPESKYLLRFFSDLEKGGNITSDQHKKALKKLQDKGLLTAEQIASWNQKSATPFAFPQRGDRLFEFLAPCLQKHMRKGARFSCYLSSSASKFDDRRFFEEIITNPFLDYKEERIDVEVPKNCDYFCGNQALVITITKLG